MLKSLLIKKITKSNNLTAFNKSHVQCLKQKMKDNNFSTFSQINIKKRFHLEKWNAPYAYSVFTSVYRAGLS